MKKILAILFLFVWFGASAQKVAVDPTITPSLFTPQTQITVVYDVTGTSLANLSSAYAWVWIPGANVDAKYNVNPASTDAAKTNNAKFVKTVENGKTLFTLTFKPADFFASDISGAAQMGILLKGNDWANGQTTDFLADIWDGGFEIRLISPTVTPLFVDNAEQITISAEAPEASDFSLYVNDVLVHQESAVEVFTYNHVVSETSGGARIKIVATNGAETAEESFQYVISAPSAVQARPVGTIPGINYGSDETKVTLCLRAPDKTSVYVLGDFSDWDVLPANQMKRDGEYFWITLTGLVPEQEYAFQYLIDETVFVGDPYADKILDPDDVYIPATVYPNLKSFPAKALKNDWYFNRLSVFQTGQDAFTWQTVNYVKPRKEELVVYELLIRDFFENGERTYKNLADTIGYFKRLGVTAIELMPVMEFNGNESWGYNPTFMFAPDKYYGPKNELKKFVDVCHANGIAVILDIALNHQDLPNANLMMDFDFASGKPKATNKWFNVTPTHPFNVFFDMNHASPYTKAYVDTINHYWLNEYRVDGFRFDLSKGFTQTFNPTNVDAWSAYDASRIAILKRMADKIWSHTPEAFVILEHLSVNQEEKELSEYRASEGKGMMLWGKMTDQYNQATMGFSENSDLSRVYHGTRDWLYPRLVSYMESHDEERLMFKNLMYGNSSGTYDVQDTTIALARQRAANVVFYTVPGPKMLWQFGELGYAYSINYCDDGTINENCRISPKPVRWDYQSDYNRSLLYDHTAELLHLRQQYDVFTDGSASFGTGTSLTKSIVLKNNPYTESPSSAEEMNAVAVANFDVVAKSVSVPFPHPGTWYDFYGNAEELSVTGASASVEFSAGGYKLYTDFPITASTIVSTEESIGFGSVTPYPNPVTNTFRVENNQVMEVDAYSITGMSVKLHRLNTGEWDASLLSPGLYVLRLSTGAKIFYSKIIKSLQ
jgi:1,4-alpha-glucan branching enzyme